MSELALPNRSIARIPCHAHLLGDSTFRDVAPYCFPSFVIEPENAASAASGEADDDVGASSSARMMGFSKKVDALTMEMIDSALPSTIGIDKAISDTSFGDYAFSHLERADPVAFLQDPITPHSGKNGINEFKIVRNRSNDSIGAVCTWKLFLQFPNERRLNEAPEERLIATAVSQASSTTRITIYEGGGDGSDNGDRIIGQVDGNFLGTRFHISEFHGGDEGEGGGDKKMAEVATVDYETNFWSTKPRKMKLVIPKPEHYRTWRDVPDTVSSASSSYSQRRCPKILLQAFSVANPEPATLVEKAGTDPSRVSVLVNR
jgi:hypothetical protein